MEGKYIVAGGLGILFIGIIAWIAGMTTLVNYCFGGILLYTGTFNLIYPY